MQKPIKQRYFLTIDPLAREALALLLEWLRTPRGSMSHYQMRGEADRLIAQLRGSAKAADESMERASDGEEA